MTVKKNLQIQKNNSIQTTQGWHWCSFQKNCQRSIQLERLLIRSLMSFETRGYVSGLLPKCGSPPALRMAITDSRWLFTAAMNRGDWLNLLKRFTSAFAAKRTGTAAGFHEAALCRGEHCQSSRALIEAPASINALTPEPDLSNQAARWRAVTWVGKIVKEECEWS